MPRRRRWAILTPAPLLRRQPTHPLQKEHILKRWFDVTLQRLLERLASNFDASIIRAQECKRPENEAE